MSPYYAYKDSCVEIVARGRKNSRIRFEDGSTLKVPNVELRQLRFCDLLDYSMRFVG